MEIEDGSDKNIYDWTTSFEQFETEISAETCLVNWFEKNNYDLTLEKHIDFLLYSCKCNMYIDGEILFFFSLL
jgi:hypothetical protein